MSTLISKYQLNNCEDGEYYAIQPRAFEDVKELIKQLDWRTEQQHFVVDITGTGICIEKDNTFLKLNNYYNNKYILYYYDVEQNVLYEKVVATVEEGIKDISIFYHSFTFEGFKKRNTTFKNIKKKFISKDFIYESNLLHPLKFSLGIYSLLLLIYYLIKLSNHVANINNFIFGPLILITILIAPILPFLFQYHRLAKNYQLIISRGNPIFKYGIKGQLRDFQKSDISSINEIGYSNSRHPLSEVQYLNVRMKCGTLLLIPCTIIDSIEFYSKLDISSIPEDETITKKWPWISKGSLIQ